MTSVAISNKLNRLTTFFADAFSESSDPSAQASEGKLSPGMKFKKIKRMVRRSKYISFIIVGVVLIVVIGLVINTGANSSSNSSSLGISEDSRVEIKKPKSSQSFEKLFLFPLKDQSGKEVGKLKLTVRNVELRDEIIVKGQRANSVKGRTFLIINIKLENDFDKAIEVNSRDYFRLSVNGSKEKLAPEIHNDPIEVQAISTKYTRIGFPIDDTYKSLELQIGEIKGKKETLKLNLN